MRTPESLIAKERYDNSRTPFGKSNGSGACASVMDDSRYTLFVKEPIVWDISKHKYMRRSRDASKSSLVIILFQSILTCLRNLYSTKLSWHTHPTETRALTPACSVASNMISGEEEKSQLIRAKQRRRYFQYCIRDMAAGSPTTTEPNLAFC